jgi:predicted nicotinamide N-methyase
MTPKSKKSSTATAKEESSAPNRPRNFLVRDATKPFDFSFLQFGKPVSIVVHQTAQDETWPGGALWDIGVILSSFFVDLAGFQSTKKEKSKPKIPIRVHQAIPNLKNLAVLELGCGVGLTGIVAAATLGTKIAVLTDLDVVVEKATKPNVELNSVSSNIGNGDCRLTKAGKRGRIIALPLCWGNKEDEDVVIDCFRKWNKNPAKSQRKKKGISKQPQNIDTGQPDLIIIGDVAYQHYPGAPSHFDILLSTVLRFLGPNTIVVFGTRMR